VLCFSQRGKTITAHVANRSFGSLLKAIYTIVWRVELTRAKEALHLQIEGVPAIKNVVICLLKRTAFLFKILQKITEEDDKFRKYWPAEQKEAADALTKAHAELQKEPAFKDIIGIDFLDAWAKLGIPALKGGVPDTEAAKEQKQIAKLEEKLKQQQIKAEQKTTKTPLNKTQNNKRKNVVAFGSDKPLDTKEEMPPRLDKPLDIKQETPPDNIQVKQENNDGKHDYEPINPQRKRKRTKATTFLLQPPKDTN
jgi:hypothetical protein